MATEFKHKITTPFAQNGTRTEIPQTSSDGSVSFDQGYTDLYSKKPSEGGKYVGRVPINYLFYLATAALKEIQEIIINGDIDALKKLQEDIQQGNIPVNMENARNILSVENGGTGTNNGFNFQNFFDYRLIGKPNATIQEFWDGLPRDFFGATYITEDTIRGLGLEYGILFFGKALNRRYLKFVEFSGNFGIYNEYVLIDNASKSNITFSDFIHTTLNSYPKRAYPFSGIRRYSSEFRTANEIHKLKMGIGDILSVNNTGSAEFRWNMDTRFPEGGQYYVDFYRVYINANNKIDRKWCGIYSGSASIGGSYDPNICFIGNIIKIS